MMKRMNSMKKHNSTQWWYRPPIVVGEGALKPQEQDVKAELYWTILLNPAEN